MTHAMQWRIDFAHSLARKLQRFDEAHTMLIGGSVAKGWADDYSDLELCMIWPALPSLDARKDIIECTGGYGRKLNELAPHKRPLIVEDHFDISDLHVDMWHCSDEGIENEFKQIITLLNTRHGQGTLYTIQKGIVLKNSQKLAGWRTRIDYPLNLSIKYVEEHLSVFPGPDLWLHVHRNDVMVFYGLISGLQKRIVRVLHGLNRVYFQGIKNTKPVLDSLPIKPKNC